MIVEKISEKKRSNARHLQILTSTIEDAKNDTTSIAK